MLAPLNNCVKTRNWVMFPLKFYYRFWVLLTIKKKKRIKVPKRSVTHTAPELSISTVVIIISTYLVLLKWACFNYMAGECWSHPVTWLTRCLNSLFHITIHPESLCAFPGDALMNTQARRKWREVLHLPSPLSTTNPQPAGTTPHI